MTAWLEIALGSAVLLGGVFVYLIRVETRLSEIKTDLIWIKKVLDSRKTPREDKT